MAFTSEYDDRAKRLFCEGCGADDLFDSRLTVGDLVADTNALGTHAGEEAIDRSATTGGYARATADRDRRGGAEQRAHTILQLETSAPLDTMRVLERVPGIGDIAVFGSGLHITVADLESGKNTIRTRLSVEGIEIHRLEKITPSLEDVFVALIETEEKKKS